MRTFLIYTLVHFHMYTLAQNVGLGLLTPEGKMHVKGSADVSQLIIDANSTQVNINPLIRLRNSIGADLMWIHSDDSTNTFMGFKAGRVNVIGPQGIDNTFLGSRAGYSNTNGWANTIVGSYALFSNIKSSRNTAIGTGALYTMSFNGGGAWYQGNNVAIGYEALYLNQPTSPATGANNTAVGTLALRSNATGSKNTAIGYNADVISDNLSNATAIGYNAKVAASNALVLGGIGGDAVNVGIGTTTPNAKLDINGTLKVADGTQGVGKILTSDATGLASWQPPPPPPPPPPVNYPVVWICCNPWMTKNLDVSTYRNGDAIPKVTDVTVWAGLTTGAYCYYDNDSTTYAATYGKLYNWYAVNDSRGLAPEGWHIPTDFEWTTLANCLGGNAVAGGPMKEIGTVHWTTPNTGATNLSGFTGLPGGNRDFLGYSNDIWDFGYWWSSSENNATYAWGWYLNYLNDDLTRTSRNKTSGFSVRCLRD